MDYKKVWGFIRAWIVISILALLAALFFLDGQKESEIANTLTFVMFIISFPASWLGFALEISMLDLFGQKQMHIYDNRLVLFLAWALFFVVGYLQWFILSRIVTAIAKKRKAKVHSAS